jgi:puromycin-sensitive aminopeptidase
VSVTLYYMKNVTHLLKNFAPKHYIVDLQIDPEAMTFRGSVEISGRKIGRPSKRLTFHQKGLTITSASVAYSSKKEIVSIPIDRLNTHKKFDELRLHSSQLLYPGDYTVSLDFEGTITDAMNGIYPCYFEHEGIKKKIIATQFESHHAREAFPCIDEPEAKATFDLSVTVPEDDSTVIGNTHVIAEDVQGNQITTKFATTPVMSTYLLAFAYGHVGYRQAKTKSGVVVRTFATPNNVEHTKFALDVAVKCLDFYEEYFAIPYPLSKCDMIALPDFASGAMENWGLVTYREQCMLMDEQNTSLPVKQYVALVVAHELAHQWFGNLVTMKWWTDLWLNEGFASWIEYLAVDNLFPKWNMWTQFVVDEQQPAFKLDALENTHPIEVPIHHPDEIRTIFDTISYNKGASVIHMLYGYLGPIHFRDGLRHYLKKHAFNNTTTYDLWQALEDISKKPVQSFMHKWTSQPGFPIVHVSVETKLNGIDSKEEQHITYTQEVYSQNHLNSNATQKSTLHWPIPTYGFGNVDALTLSKDVHDAVVTQESDVPYYINVGRRGFYRTTYDKNHLDILGQAIKDQKIPTVDRLGLLSDVFEAAKTGYMPLTDALSLLSCYSNESDAAVWDIITMQLADMRRVMDDDDVRESCKPYIRQLVAKELDRLSWDQKKHEDHFDTLLRPNIIGLAASADNEAVVDECIRRFSQMKKPEDIPSDLRGVVYTTAARKGGRSEFNKLIKLHSSTESSEEKLTIAAALTGFKQPELYTESLSLITSPMVRKQDAMYWVAYSLGNRHAKHATWQWMKDKWKWLDNNLGDDLSFYRTPIYAARSFSDSNFIKEYRDFFDQKHSAVLTRSIKQGLEMLEWQVNWKQRDLSHIRTFFKNN